MEHGITVRRIPQPAPPTGSLLEAAGRRLFVDIKGSGGPPVIFLAGAGLSGLDYFGAQQRVAEFATVVLYDRSGTGWSDPAPVPITSTAVTDELRALLQEIGIDGPAVLVGHSLGGLYARHYASRFPDKVAGLVLLDPAHENYDAHMPEELRQKRGSDPTLKILDAVMSVALRTRFTRALLARVPAVKRYATLYRRLFADEMSSWPRNVTDSLVERHGSVEWLAVGLNEARNIETRYAEVRAAGPLPDIPLVILSSMRTDPFQEAVAQGVSPELVRAEREGKTLLYKELAASVPRGEVRMVDSGHVTIALRCADEVARAVRDVTRAID